MAISGHSLAKSLQYLSHSWRNWAYLVMNLVYLVIYWAYSFIFSLNLHYGPLRVIAPFSVPPIPSIGISIGIIPIPIPVSVSVWDRYRYGFQYRYRYESLFSIGIGVSSSMPERYQYLYESSAWYRYRYECSFWYRYRYRYGTDTRYIICENTWYRCHTHTDTSIGIGMDV